MTTLTPVGVFGFCLDNRVMRVRQAGKVEITWVLPRESTDDAKRMIRGMIRDANKPAILVIHPACAHLVADMLRQLPQHITLVARTQPFTSDGIDI